MVQVLAIAACDISATRESYTQKRSNERNISASSLRSWTATRNRSQSSKYLPLQMRGGSCTSNGSQLWLCAFSRSMVIA